eukprot:jgi/Mesvir1/11006/Mv25973-RA.1
MGEDTTDHPVLVIVENVDEKVGQTRWHAPVGLRVVSHQSRAQNSDQLINATLHHILAIHIRNGRKIGVPRRLSAGAHGDLDSSVDHLHKISVRVIHLLQTISAGSVQVPLRLTQAGHRHLVINGPQLIRRHLIQAAGCHLLYIDEPPIGVGIAELQFLVNQIAHSANLCLHYRQHGLPFLVRGLVHTTQVGPAELCQHVQNFAWQILESSTSMGHCVFYSCKDGCLRVDDCVPGSVGGETYPQTPVTPLLYPRGHGVPR